MKVFQKKKKKKKNKKFSKSNNKKSQNNQEGKWGDQCKVKHVGQCLKIVTCYQCGTIGHYARKYTANHKFCLKCGEFVHFKDDLPKIERSFQIKCTKGKGIPDDLRCKRLWCLTKTREGSHFTKVQDSKWTSYINNNRMCSLIYKAWRMNKSCNHFKSYKISNYVTLFST